MKITYYKSVVCPRCMPVSKVLAEMTKEHPEIEVERIEVLTHPGSSLKAGVRQIPTLKIGDEMKTWFLPSRQEVRSFIDSHLADGAGDE